MFRLFGIRFLNAIIVLFVVTLAVFLLTHAVGNPVRSLLGTSATEQQVHTLERALGFDQPLWRQYWRFLRGALIGNFGTSSTYNIPATQVLRPAIIVTLKLAVGAAILTLAVGIPMGLAAGYFANSVWDRGIVVFLTLAQATPIFVTGIILIVVFAIRAHLLPAGGGTGWSSYVLPWVALALGGVAPVIKLSRTSLREVLLQPYVLLARAKGLSEIRILLVHCLRNVGAPLFAYGGLLLGGLLTGAVVTEQLFGLDGLGETMLSGVNDLDFNVIQAGVMMIAVAFVAANFVSELLQAAVDPRARIRTRTR
jgi:peptide/nickel transport system permease protein